MNVSRFVGSTNREALRQVRLALGPDAMILSNRRINGGVEIMAADPTWAHAATASGQAATETSLLSTLTEMRDSLESRMQALMWGSQLSDTPNVASLFQTLLSCGLSTALLHAMLKRLPAALAGRAALQWARDELVAHLPHVGDDDDFLCAGSLIALVGPTGVGKTTTIAKLAARCVRRFGTAGLVLVTTDTWRIGAHEQLLLYGQMLGVPVHVARDGVELDRIIQALEPEQILLVDNVGVSQRDRRVHAQAALLASASRPIQRLLVLNAASHGDTLDDVAQAYASDGGPPLRGCVVSKVDEAIRLGAVLDTAIRYQLPIRYVSGGQRVPEDLGCPTAAVLVDQALAPRPRARALYVPSEADLAALLRRGQGNASHQSGGPYASRQRLLSALLAVTGAGKKALTHAEIDAACAYIDDTPALAMAYDAWRHRARAPGPIGQSAPMAPMPTAADMENSGVVTGWLAAHLQMPLPAHQCAAGQLGAVLLFSPGGQAWAAPLRHVRRPEGWQSSCGAVSAGATGPSQSLLHQVEWLARQPGLANSVQYCDNARQGLLRHMHEQGLKWVTAVPPSAAVSADGHMTTVAALGKVLDYRPITLPALTVLPDGVGAEAQAWVADQAVVLGARGQAPLPARLLVLRFSGAARKTLYGLTCPDIASSAPLLDAHSLLTGHHAKIAMRHAIRMWPVLRRDGGDDLSVAGLATQVGLAAWQLAQAHAELPIRRMASRLAGLKADADAPFLVLRLFAIKEMLQG